MALSTRGEMFRQDNIALRKQVADLEGQKKTLVENFHAVEDEKKALALEMETLKADWQVLSDRRGLVDKELETQRLFWEGKEAASERTFTELRKRCLLYTSPSPRDATLSRMPSSA